jgi:hypothetical protein
MAIHSPINKKNPKFQILGSRLFERWTWSICWTHKHASFLIFCGFFWVANDVVQGVSNRFKDGLVIWLWKLDDQGHPKLFSGIPKHVPLRPILGNDVSKWVEKKIFINSGILKYLEFWSSIFWKMRCMLESWSHILNIAQVFRMLVKTNFSTKSYIVRGLLAN